MSFVTLHVLNLCTTLTPATAIARIYHSTPGIRTGSEPEVNGVRKVDIGESSVAQALEFLKGEYGIGTTSSSNEVMNRTSDDLRETEKEVLVRISAPIRVHVTTIPTSGSTAKLAKSMLSSSSTISSFTLHFTFSPRAYSARWENFLSAWTTLVGDPVLSKWIVLALVASVTLNAFLLKGIAFASGQGVLMGIGGLVPSVRFSAGTFASGRERARRRGRDDERSEESEKEDGTDGEGKPEKPRRSLPVLTPINTGSSPVSSETHAKAKAHSERLREAFAKKVQEMPPAAPLVHPEPVRPSVASVAVNSLALDLVDQKLAQAQAKKGLQLDLSSSSSVPSPESETRETRSLEECVDIFENGPRPVSVSLALLNDEEVIILCKAGRIQAYALEKMLGNFERAVRIRRALICAQ